MEVLIIDDNEHSISIIEHYLKECFGIYSNTKCSDYICAEELLEKKDFDIIFLDIMLDHDISLYLLEKFKIANRCIITTAHDEYALQAIRYGVVDYLLKPIFEDEFILVVNKLFKETSNKKFRLKVGTNIEFIELSDLLLVEASGPYCKFILKDKEHLISKPLKHFILDLESLGLIRISKSFVVNPIYVSKIDGDYIILESGAKLKISKSKLAKIKKELFN